MALTDHSDVFIGSTGDGWTFVVLNRRIRNGARILTGAGFTAREHQGRTLYLLPPETAQDAHERAGVAAYGLMAHTLDLVDLAWTTRQHGGTPSREPDVTICFTDHAGGEAAVRAVTRARRKRRSQRRCPRRVPPLRRRHQRAHRPRHRDPAGHPAGTFPPRRRARPAARPAG